MRIPASLAALGALLLFAAPHRAFAQNIDAPSMMEMGDDSPDQADAPAADADPTAVETNDAPAHRHQKRPVAGTKAEDATPATSPVQSDPEDATPGDATDEGTPSVKPAKAASPKSTAPREALKPILPASATDKDLVAAWNRWHQAVVQMRPQEAEAAQKELIALKADLAVEDLEAFSVGFVRASEVRQKEKDSLGSVTLAQTAVTLAPDLPYAHLGLAQAYLDSDPFSLGRYFQELGAASRTALKDPRYRRAIVADVGAAALGALVATAALTLLVLFLRKARYLFHDVHHLFPRAARPWQSAAVVLLLLSLPVVFRLGLVPVLLTLFAAVCLHLGAVERVVAALMLAVLALVPVAASALAEHTTFAGTVAEDVYLLERGGLMAAEAAGRVEHRVAENKADVSEQFALARYLARRGKLPDAISLFKQAAARKTGDARLLTNLGNAILIQGDEEGAAELYLQATQADPALADAYFDLAKVYYRRAATVSDDQVGPELDRAQSALTTAQRLDPALLRKEDPPAERLLANRLLLSPGLTAGEITRLTPDDQGPKIAAQLASRLVGDFDPLTGVAYPVVIAGVLLLIGWVRRGRGVSKGCDKCGRPVCRRCDPELGVGSMLCNQCVHVFARKGAVPSAVKLKKQIDIRRYRQARNRMSYVLAAVCSGMGHLFSGLPVRGALYAFLFLFGVANVVLRDGVLRTPYGPVPLWMTLVPAGALMAVVYFLSLRGLYRKQAE
jgi:tetratricopeptide (TPR) repeat protein